MGRKSLEISIRMVVSDHNSDQDVADMQAAEDLAQRVRAIADEPKYKDIVLWTEGPTDV